MATHAEKNAQTGEPTRKSLPNRKKVGRLEGSLDTFHSRETAFIRNGSRGAMVTEWLGERSKPAYRINQTGDSNFIEKEMPTLGQQGQDCRDQRARCPAGFVPDRRYIDAIIRDSFILSSTHAAGPSVIKGEGVGGLLISGN